MKKTFSLLSFLLMAFLANGMLWAQNPINRTPMKQILQDAMKAARSPNKKTTRHPPLTYLQFKKAFIPEEKKIDDASLPKLNMTDSECEKLRFYPFGNTANFKFYFVTLPTQNSSLIAPGILVEVAEQGRLIFLSFGVANLFTVEDSTLTIAQRIKLRDIATIWEIDEEMMVKSYLIFDGGILISKGSTTRLNETLSHQVVIPFHTKCEYVFDLPLLDFGKISYALLKEFPCETWKRFSFQSEKSSLPAWFYTYPN